MQTGKKCEFNWISERGATRIAGKVEWKGSFDPTGINWKARGVTFVLTADSAGEKFQCRARRQWQGVAGLQRTAEEYRNLKHKFSKSNDDQEKWENNGSPKAEDCQYPTDKNVMNTDVLFRIDGPGQEACKQLFFRVDFVESLQWYDGWSGWATCSQYGDWHINITGKKPNCTKDTPNGTGRGQTEHKAPNSPPNIIGIVGVSPRVVNTGSQVILTAGAGDTNDDDEFKDNYYEWEQTQGSVALTPADGKAKSITFTAPANPTTLKFRVRAKDGTFELDRWAPGNHWSEWISIKVIVQ